jgi:hypothetical protein
MQIAMTEEWGQRPRIHWHSVFSFRPSAAHDRATPIAQPSVRGRPVWFFLQAASAGDARKLGSLS